MDYRLIEAENDEEFVKKSVELLENEITSVLSKSGRSILGLSGGLTPKRIYEALAARPIDWSNVWIFLVDERYVSPDHSDSNQRMIRETLLSKVGAPPDHFIAPDTWKPLEECVHLYDTALRELLGKGQPDVVTLGLGEDGHLASLFPPVPDEAWNGPLAIHTTTESFTVADRITVTMPLLLQAQLPVFFLQGEKKKRVWTKMQRSIKNPKQWPAQELLSTGRCVTVACWQGNAGTKA